MCGGDACSEICNYRNSSESLVAKPTEGKVVNGRDTNIINKDFADHAFLESQRVYPKAPRYHMVDQRTPEEKSITTANYNLMEDARTYNAMRIGLGVGAATLGLYLLNEMGLDSRYVSEAYKALGPLGTSVLTSAAALGYSLFRKGKEMDRDFPQFA